jgi:hypothetical protein
MRNRFMVFYTHSNAMYSVDLRVDLNTGTVREEMFGYISSDWVPDQIRGRLNLLKLLPIHKYCEDLGFRGDDYVSLMMNNEEFDSITGLLLTHTVPDPYNVRPTE